MNTISGLTRILSQQLGWHKARIDFLAQALIGLLICRSINFQEIATAMPSSKAEIKSRYRRIQRFFANYSFNFDVIARWLYQLFFSNSDRVYIAIDRTNWFFGKRKINIFMLSVCYEGIAIPIYWRLLKKAGNSSGEEHIDLLSRFVKTFGKTSIQGVLADREFPNKKFISWLTQQQIPFFIRIKGNTAVCIGKKKWKEAASLFPHLKLREPQVFKMRVTVFSKKLYLAASKNERDELMIVVTNSNPQVAIACYLRRWEVETLFQAFKGRGFRFEDTHVTALDRLERMIAFLAIAFAFAHKSGEWKAERKPIPLKRIRKQLRYQNSYFRYGLDFVRDLFTQLKPKPALFRKLFALLEPN